MNKNKVVTVAFLALVVGAGLGFYFGYDIGFEKAAVVPEGWKVSEGRGFLFSYPETLGTKYISTVEWPPEVELQQAIFSCAEPIKQINGRDYCASQQIGAAAGSRYVTYIYHTLKDEGMVTVRFALRYPECANYEDPQKSECETERQAFDADDLADRIAQSVRKK